VDENPYLRSEVQTGAVSDERAVDNAYLTGKLLPYARGGADYVVLRPEPHAGSGLPVPPMELWEDYASTPEGYLECGRQDTATMLGILGGAGESPDAFRRVLDFGCAAARMLRFYPNPAGDSELWGVDVNAKHMVWCQQHLSPPMQFATTTTAPHLPFEDNYFDLVYCASVFTHITDLADAWFLELRRVVRPGGYVYLTIHDKHTLELLFTTFKDREGFGAFVEQVRRFDEKTSIRTLDYLAFAIGADPYSQVFYDVDDLTRKWGRLAPVVSVTPEAHDHQTAVLFRKRF
jgi:ubiquinone/menaquinone biosynthesis C-methylase UbiE